MGVPVSSSGATRRKGVARPAAGTWRSLFKAGTLTLLTAASLLMDITHTSRAVLDQQYVASVPEPVATLAFAGTDPVITGSVDAMFAAVSFSGPTSSLKTNRLRADVDLMEFSRSFLAERQRIAALNNGSKGSSDPAAPVPGTLREVDSPRAVAAIDPALASAALAAIQDATPTNPDVPQPLFASERLAYSRQNTPTTETVVNRYSQRERWCMATAVYFEARGESYRGQVGVAQVVMNRVKHRLYPNTICGVVFQNQSWRNRCQFSFACDGIPETVTDRRAWAQAMDITNKVTSGSLYLSEVANATHYHATYVYPDWAPRMKRVTRIGHHVFYRFRRG